MPPLPTRESEGAGGSERELRKDGGERGKTGLARLLSPDSSLSPLLGSMRHPEAYRKFPFLLANSPLSSWLEPFSVT